MDVSRDDTIVVEYTRNGTRERVVFEPALGDGWNRLEQFHTGCDWRTRGVERVFDVTVETPVDDQEVSA